MELPFDMVLAGSNGTVSSPHDCIIYAMWIVPVYDNAVWTARSSSHVPATHGQSD